MSVFPKNQSQSTNDDTLCMQLFGRRIFSDQTLNEYLLEFLLVFASAKQPDGSGALSFHTAAEVEGEPLRYHTKPRVGLKRFVFYDRSKRESRSGVDTKAYEDTMQMLLQHSDAPDWPLMLQDLLYGYSSVLKNRGWYAQSLIPVAPELIFPETLGIHDRQKMDPKNTPAETVETDFEYGKHDFLARGGEMYYLHLLQGMQHPGFEGYRERLAGYLRNMLTECSQGFSLIADSIHRWWQINQGINPNLKLMNLGYTQDGFDARSERSLQELTTFLSSSLLPIARIEIMTKGILLALLRQMHLQAWRCVHGPAAEEPVWYIDMRYGNGTCNVAKIAAKSYRSAHEDFGAALNLLFSRSGLAESERFSTLSKEKKHSAEVFKKMGKEIQLIIPLTGANTRFTLSEDLVRYLVLALIRPYQKITFDSFLDLLYEHYRMVIGPRHYRKASSSADSSMAGYFELNERTFQSFLKNCGFLRELSDSISVVENPYEEVKLT